MIAQQIRGALDEAGGGAVKVVIVSAEPHADTPASVKAFLERNDLAGRVLYLTGSPRN